ncbi:hypothetical protein VNO78_27449 [Psophocarpus tetragonolobus]|uniref:Uncharacterized protein n=1 Tax=Psophocarpus tetragonolobus TaxID=3891 RepID=A0AAN9S0R6_PSOTE
MALRVAKSHGILDKTSKLGRQMAKPRVLALSIVGDDLVFLAAKSKGQGTTTFLRVLKYSTLRVLELAQLYKLKYLSKVEPSNHIALDNILTITIVSTEQVLKLVTASQSKPFFPTQQVDPHSYSQLLKFF